jgi:hypothetical protein
MALLMMHYHILSGGQDRLAGRSAVLGDPYPSRRLSAVHERDAGGWPA